MKIYTKNGDQGKTSLIGGDAVYKNELRVESYGAVDELNAQIGFAITFVKDEILKKRLIQIQNHLFCLGSELASVQLYESVQKTFIQICEVEELEKIIDEYEAQLKPLTQFILPGGSQASAALHVCRGQCRRAERKVSELYQKENIRVLCIQYLNRLSDAFFVMARYANFLEKIEDEPWMKK